MDLEVGMEVEDIVKIGGSFYQIREQRARQIYYFHSYYDIVPFLSRISDINQVIDLINSAKIDHYFIQHRQDIKFK